MSISIEPWRPEYAGDFSRLNRAWIEQYFVLEPPDIALLDDPGTSIIAPGGEIFFAVLDGVVIGTAAAVKHAPGELELGKTAVAPAHQGQGIGRMLAQAVIDHARASNAQVLFLLTNHTLETAIRLYERLGFRHVALPSDSEYARADVRMEFPLR